MTCCRRIDQSAETDLYQLGDKAFPALPRIQALMRAKRTIHLA
jgi:hypothetical protein